MAQEPFERQPDVLDDLAKQHRRNVPARMVRNSRATAVRVAILPMRAALPREVETKGLQDAADLTRLENGWLGHELRRDVDALGADKLRRQFRFAVLQKHSDDLAEIALKLVE